jgi:hypothetical protein
MSETGERRNAMSSTTAAQRATPSHWALRVYVAAVAVAGGAALALAAPSLAVDRWYEVLFFFALMALAQRMPVFLFRNSSMSVAFAIGIAALVYFGPATATVIQIAAGLVLGFYPRRKPVMKFSFNLAALPLQQAVTGAVYVAIGGVVAPERLEWMLLPPAIVAITVFILLNTLMISLAVALETGSGIRTIFNMNFRWLLPNYVGVGLVGLGMGVAAQTVGLPGVSIFFIPLAMAWYSYKLYMAKTLEVRQRNEELQLANARLDVANAHLHQRVTELSTLNRIGLSLNSSLDLGNVLGEILSSTLQVVNGQGAAVALAEPSTGNLAVASSVGVPRAAAAALEAMDGPVARTLATGTDLSIPDTASTGAGELAEAGIGAVHCWPLRFKGETTGVFAVTFAGAQELAPEQRVLLATLTEQAAAAVHNARLYQEIEQGYLSTVQAMVSVVDARERYAQGHSERVRAFCSATAKQLGLPEKQTSTLELAAMFHDIGHIGVPESVLNKPGELTREEWEMVRKHPLLGATILKQVPRMESVAQVILQHHERYDGQGYPGGLLGDEIQVMSQVLAVSDAYEALTSRRPHRPALPREAAIAELRKNSGSQFAPQVVDAFIAATARALPATAPAQTALLRHLQAEQA